MRNFQEGYRELKKLQLEKEKNKNNDKDAQKPAAS